MGASYLHAITSISVIAFHKMAESTPEPAPQSGIESTPEPAPQSGTESTPEPAPQSGTEVLRNLHPLFNKNEAVAEMKLFGCYRMEEKYSEKCITGGKKEIQETYTTKESQTNKFIAKR